MFCPKKHFQYLTLLSVNFTKWSNTLKQFVGNLATNCLSVFDHFVGSSVFDHFVSSLTSLVGLALKGIISSSKLKDEQKDFKKNYNDKKIRNIGHSRNFIIAKNAFKVLKFRNIPRNIVADKSSSE